MTTAGPLFETQTQLAEWLRVSRVTLRAWIQRGMPTRGKGFDGGEVVRWRLKQPDMALQQAKGDDASRLKAAQIRKLEAQAEITDLRRRQLAGELIDARMALVSITILLATVRARLQAIPSELAAGIPADVRHDTVLNIENGINGILVEMSHFRVEGIAKEEINRLFQLLKDHKPRIAEIVDENRRRFKNSRKGVAK